MSKHLFNVSVLAQGPGVQFRSSVLTEPLSRPPEGNLFPSALASAFVGCLNFGISLGAPG